MSKAIPTKPSPPAAPHTYAVTKTSRVPGRVVKPVASADAESGRSEEADQEAPDA